MAFDRWIRSWAAQGKTCLGDTRMKLEMNVFKSIKLLNYLRPPFCEEGLMSDLADWLGITPSTFLFSASSSNSVLNWIFKIQSSLQRNVEVLKTTFLHAFAMKKSLRQQNWGVKCCSSCCNYFIIFMTTVCYSTKCGMAW